MILTIKEISKENHASGFRLLRPITPYEANLSPITLHADNLAAITRQGKPLCYPAVMVRSFPSVAIPPSKSPRHLLCIWNFPCSYSRKCPHWGKQIRTKFPPCGLKYLKICRQTTHPGDKTKGVFS